MEEAEARKAPSNKCDLKLEIGGWEQACAHVTKSHTHMASRLQPRLKTSTVEQKTN